MSNDITYLDMNPFPGCIRVKDPDFEMISALIVQAKGKRSLTEYAAACGVSTSTLSRLVNMKTTTPSSDLLIYKLGVNADPDSGVVVEMFREAHGLAEVKIGEGSIPSPSAQFLKKKEGTKLSLLEIWVKDIIQNYLISDGASLKICADTNVIKNYKGIRYKADFVFETDYLQENGISKWAFDIHNNPSRPLMHKLSWMFGAAYIDPLHDNGIKLTLVVTNETEFLEIRDYLNNLRIKDDISIMYVDVSQHKVCWEYSIPKEQGGR